MFYKLYIYSEYHKKYLYLYDKVLDNKIKKDGYISRISVKGENHKTILKNKNYIEVTYDNCKKMYYLEKLETLKIFK